MENKILAASCTVLEPAFDSGKYIDSKQIDSGKYIDSKQIDIL